jgi:hypothetical protein
MKNIIIILIGIIIGSGSTLLIQQARITILNEVNGVDYGGIKATDLSTDNLIVDFGGKFPTIKATDLSTDNLNIVDFKGKFLTVAPKKNPNVYVFFDLQGDGFYQVALHDENGSIVSFQDRNSDGKWDDANFTSGNTTFGYEGLDGFPDHIMSDEGVKIRIGEDYFNLKIEGKIIYIEKDGEWIEVERIPNSFYQFKIKNSDWDRTPHR